MERSYQITPEILAAFDLDTELAVEPMFNGHINDTFRLSGKQGEFIVQRINHYVFPSPEQIMENIAGVTSFLREKITRRGGNPDRETLTIRPTRDGSGFFLDSGGNYWRCTLYIPHTSSYESSLNSSMFREAGRAFGDFQSMLGDYPADTLHEIIPNFHNTPARFAQLMEAVRNDAAGRVKEVQAELEFAQAREKGCSLLMNLLAAGQLPLRVTHNDTKLSNVLFDDATGQAVCVIDLDTVMPGLTAFDFGDSIRAGASTAAEDEQDLSKVHFDAALFEAYAHGFLSAAGSVLTAKELSTLPDGAIWITFETGIRFLADYLNGDSYFRTAYPNHNLVRARNQFKLVEEMEQKRTAMEEIVETCARQITSFPQL